VKLLDRPVAVDQVGGEPVEKLRVHGLVAAHSEVIGCGDEWLAEVVHPNPVDENALRQRILWRGNGPGKFQSATAVMEGLAIRLREDAEKSPGYRITRSCRVAPLKDPRLDGNREVRENHRSLLPERSRPRSSYG